MTGRPPVSQGGCSANTKVRDPLQCTFCGEGHFHGLCAVEMKPSESRTLVRAKGACDKCGKCGCCHVDNLCVAQDASQPSTAPRAQHHESQAAHHRERDPQERSCSYFVRNGVATGHQDSLLLKTCAVHVNGMVVTRGLIDTGCNRTLVRGEMAKSCGAEVVGRRRMVVNAF